jgi:hypothetical protein
MPPPTWIWGKDCAMPSEITSRHEIALFGRKNRTATAECRRRGTKKWATIPHFPHPDWETAPGIT